MNSRQLLIASILFVAVSFGWGSSAREEAERLFHAGNVYYGEERFAEAREAYYDALAYRQSTALHFNLANTYFQIGDTGRAILHYMRAQALRPGDPDITANLRFVREAAAVDPPPDSLFAGFSASLPRAAWIGLCLGGLWTGLLAFFVFPQIARPRIGSRLLGGLALTASLVALLALVADRANRDLGVVLVDEAALRVAPTSASPSEATARAGETAVIRETRNQFKNVRFADGRSGFLTPEEFAPVQR